MTEQAQPQPSIAGLDHVLGHFEGRIDDDTRQELLQILLDREDNMADLIRLAGMQFGAIPQLTAKVLMDIGIGSPVSEDQRSVINAQFGAAMEELRQHLGDAFGESS